MNLINIFEKDSINNNEIKDFFEDFDFCIKYLGNTRNYEIAFVKKDFDLEDNDIVVVIEYRDFFNVVGEFIKNTNITLRRVVKIGDQIQLRDIKNIYAPINIGSSEEVYKILGKAIYRLCLFD